MKKNKKRILILGGSLIIIFLIVDLFLHDEIFKRPAFEVPKEEYYKFKKEYLKKGIKHVEEEFNKKNNNEKYEIEGIRDVDGINDFTLKEQKDFLDYLKESYEKADKEYIKSKGTKEIIFIPETEAIYLNLRKKRFFLIEMFYRMEIIKSIFIIFFFIFIIWQLIMFIIFIIADISKK